MAKIASIGADSLGFTRGLLRDLPAFLSSENATLALVDLAKERLAFAKRAVETLAERCALRYHVPERLNDN